MAVTRTDFGAGGVILTNGAIEARGKGAYHWLDLNQPSDDELASLQETYGFHPLTIEDCKHFDQRAKVEEYEGYLFITLATPRYAADGVEMEADELHSFLSDQYLVTVHEQPLPLLDSVRQRLLADRGKVKTSPDFMLYLLCDQLVDSYFPLMDGIEDEINRLEDEIVESPDRSTLTDIFRLKQRLVYLRKTVAPERELLHLLSGARFAAINQRTAVYFRDVYDHLLRINEAVDASRDLLSNALDAYLSVQSNRLSEVMKRMTLIATIFMPLSFLVGFGGMNFTALPFDSQVFLLLLLGLCALTPIFMITWFFRSKWL